MPDLAPDLTLHSAFEEADMHLRHLCGVLERHAGSAVLPIAAANVPRQEMPDLTLQSAFAEADRRIAAANAPPPATCELDDPDDDDDDEDEDREAAEDED